MAKPVSRPTANFIKRISALAMYLHRWLRRILRAYRDEDRNRTPRPVPPNSLNHVPATCVHPPHVVHLYSDWMAGRYEIEVKMAARPQVPGDALKRHAQFVLSRQAVERVKIRSHQVYRLRQSQATDVLSEQPHIRAGAVSFRHAQHLGDMSTAHIGARQ